VLQIRCYTTGTAFQSAQADISQAAMEDAGVRGIFAWSFLKSLKNLRTQETLHISSVPQMFAFGEEILRLQN